MEDTKEYRRVLSNPDNLIISEELQGVIDEYPDESPEKDVPHKEEQDVPVQLRGKIFIGDSSYECFVKKISRRQNNTFKIKARVPKFSIYRFINYEDVKMEFHDMFFTSEESPCITYSDSGILTFTARRILKNEKV